MILINIIIVVVLFNSPTSRTESLQAQNANLLLQSCKKASNMQRRPRILDGPRYATKMRRRPQHIIQMLQRRGQLEGDIGELSHDTFDENQKRCTICDAGHDL